MIAHVAVIACATFFGLSAVTFAGAVVLVRRARRAEANARDYLREGMRERHVAQAIHANCRPSPFSVRAETTLFGRAVQRGAA